MASNFRIQKPYVVTELPLPLDRPDGQPGEYVCGEVFGQQRGSSKKRKRSEISVGIDGDAVNIYDVRALKNCVRVRQRLTRDARSRRRDS
jgi:hypothetical protein